MTAPLSAGSIICGTPSILTALGNPEDYPCVRVAAVGGEACPMRLVATWAPHCVFWNQYGPTECTVDATWQRLNVDATLTSASSSSASRSGGVVTIGRPIPGSCASIVDPSRFPLRRLPQGAAGELLVAGAGTARGYLKRPARTREAFVSSVEKDIQVASSRWYRTGDLCRWRCDGRIEYLGRIDHQVKLRGHRIELGEIESVVLGLEGVSQAVAVVVVSCVRACVCLCARASSCSCDKCPHIEPLCEDADFFVVCLCLCLCVCVRLC